ncbi:Monooxygenase FAD-binding protein [Neofusicoccum parvum]|nr:Monooxygenase FAD-binding protein [Neofusicoccum parvum]
MLEKFDIDYVILEAYPTVAPQLGASIGLLPSGLRILDQLGCFERLRAMVGNCYYQNVLRRFDGRVLAKKKPITFSERLENKIGYPQMFIDRQMLLQVLFDNLKFKDRVLTQKRVTHVDTTEGCVHVRTQDGCTYSGDIVVGADGIHSAVRNEMWRNANEANSNLFHSDELSRLQSDSKCIFGISKRPSGLQAGPIQINAFFDGWNYMMLSAPQDRLYWFFFNGMEKASGKDIPKFTKEDEVRLAKQHFGDYVTETTTFEDIYNNRQCSTLVAVEEHVFARWHFGRIIVIGDAAHKVHPITAQGGNSAMETAAALVNALRRKLDPGSTNGRLSEKDVEDVFAEVQAIRFDRAAAAIEQGRRSKVISTRDTLLSRIFVHGVLAWFGDLLILTLVLQSSKNSPVIEDLEVPKRLVTSTRPKGNWGLWRTGVFGAGLLAVLLYNFS